MGLGENWKQKIIGRPQWTATLQAAKTKYDNEGGLEGMVQKRRLMTSIPPIEPFSGQNFALSVSVLAGVVIGVMFLSAAYGKSIALKRIPAVMVGIPRTNAMCQTFELLLPICTCAVTN